MGVSDLKVQVHLDIDVNGEPVTQLLRLPASVESDQQGMTVHLHLDAHQLAKALLPELLQLMRRQASRLDYGFPARRPGQYGDVKE